MGLTQMSKMKKKTIILVPLIAFFISLSSLSFSIEKGFYGKGLRTRAVSAPEGYLEKRNGILVLHLKGNPYEMGFQHGMLTKHLMGKSKEAFDRAVPPIKGGRVGAWIVKRYLFWKLGKMEKYVPGEFVEELKGMADSITEKVSDPEGSLPRREVDYREILLYHAMRDIGQVLARPVRDRSSKDDRYSLLSYLAISNGGCSSFVVLPQAAKNRKLIYGRNFDFLKGGSLKNLVTFYEPDKGNSFVSIGWPGMTGVVSGMNDKGLTVGILTAYSEDVSFDGMPSCFLMRKVLQYANNVEEAKEIIIQTKRTGPNIFLLADEKEALVVECSATKYALRKPQGGLLYSSNHFLSPVYEKDRKRRKALESGESEARYKRMEKLLKKRYGQIDVEYGIKILKDDIILKDNTLHSVIFRPRTLEFSIAQGPGARGEFIKFNLEKPEVNK